MPTQLWRHFPNVHAAVANNSKTNVSSCCHHLLLWLSDHFCRHHSLLCTF